MKTLIYATGLALACAVIVLLSGCSTVGKMVDDIPEGHADRIHYTRTGKFSSTTAEVTGWDKTDTTVAVEKLHIRHSNAWMPNVEIEMEGYRRERGEAPAHASNQ